MQALERSLPAQLVQRQDERLAALLAYAQARSPYYGERWGKTEPVNRSNARAYLATLPLIAKPDLQAHYQDMLAEPRVRRVTRKVTGGSTGQAVTIVKDRTATAAEMAATWMGLGWFGIHVGDRAARFWGTPFSARRRLRFRAADFTMHRTTFSAFAFTDEDLERYWKRCLEFRPAYFYGYVSMLEAFAAFVRRRGLPGRDLKLKAVVSTSEVLSSAQRAMLEDVFGTRVQNEYGCGEFGPIAYECEHGSLHIMSENLVVEVLGADGRPAAAGESGELVITDLNNFAMPMVRYRVGDFGVLGDGCSCNRGFPVLANIWGRAYDFVETPDGRRHHGEFLMYLFEDFRREGFGIEQFQVTQTEGWRLEVLVTSPAPIAADRIERVRAELETRLAGLHVTVRQVPAIERLASGKMHVIRRVGFAANDSRATRGNAREQ
jgi:phenylacetate-CoA ligase